MLAFARFIHPLQVSCYILSYSHIVPFPGIIDFQMVARHYAKGVVEKGHEITTGFEVLNFDDQGGDYPISIKSKGGDEIRAKHVVTCAGLHSDRMAAKSGGEELPKIIPFRGDYLLLNPDKAGWINGKCRSLSGHIVA